MWPKNVVTHIIQSLHNFISILAKDPYSMISNAGDQVILPKPTSRADHIDMTTTVPDLDLTPSEQISIPKHHATSSSSSSAIASRYDFT